MIDPSAFASLLKGGARVEDEITRALCESSLYEFIKEFWDIVEPSRTFIEGWHLRWLCRELESITRVESTRLLANLPPGSMKSLCMVFWTCWEWGPKKMPHLRYMCAAYTQNLTLRDNRRRKMILNSEKYKRLWPEVVLDPNKSGDENFANLSTGWCLATSTGGVGTGERADRILIDDAHNVRTAESDAIRASVLQWWREVIPTRVNDPVRSAMVVIMQRVHEDDIAGDILENRLLDGWIHVCVPMSYEPDRHCVTPEGEDVRGLDADGNLLPGMGPDGFVDPDSPLGRRRGMLYWPERFPLSTVERDKVPLGEFGVSAQFQQLPSPRGGGLVKDIWWLVWPPDDEYDRWVERVEDERGSVRLVKHYPPSEFTMAYVDTAFTENDESAFSALVCFSVFADSSGRPRVIMKQGWEDRPTLRGLCSRIIETARRYKIDVIVIENRAGASWVRQEMQRILGRSGEFSVVLDEPFRDKTARLISVAPLFEDGVVFAPKTEWADLVIKRVSQFPKGKYKDLVDCVSGGLGYLRRNDLIKLSVEHDEDEREAKTHKGNQESIAEFYGVA